MKICGRHIVSPLPACILAVRDLKSQFSVVGEGWDVIVIYIELLEFHRLT